MELWQKEWLESDEGRAVNKACFNSDRILERVSVAISEARKTGLMSEFAFGALSSNKNKGLYVDIGSSGEILESPDMITKDLAEQYVQLANSAVRWLNE